MSSSVLHVYLPPIYCIFCRLDFSRFIRRYRMVSTDARESLNRAYISQIDAIVSVCAIIFIYRVKRVGRFNFEVMINLDKTIINCEYTDDR